jgi:hypothetical protein
LRWGCDMTKTEKLDEALRIRDKTIADSYGVYITGWLTVHQYDSVVVKACDVCQSTSNKIHEEE